MRLGIARRIATSSGGHTPEEPGLVANGKSSYSPGVVEADRASKREPIGGLGVTGMFSSWCWLGACVLGQPLPLLPQGSQTSPGASKPVPAVSAGGSADSTGGPNTQASPGRKVRPVDRPDLPSGEWQAPLKLTSALENVYRGTVSEECFTPQTQYARSYRLESRLLVLEPRQDGWDLAFLTTLRERDTANRGNGALNRDSSIAASRLAKGGVDGLGHLDADLLAKNQGTGLGGVIHETGMVVELPPGKMRPGEPWETRNGDEPVTRWEVKGREVLQGTACVVVGGEQKTDTWDKPRADRGAWRRVDKIWVNQRTGLATKVERTIEKREPARQDVAERTVVRYELDSSVQYPKPLYEDRLKDVEQTLKLSQSSEPLLGQGVRQAQAMGQLLKRAEKVFELYPPTPYRSAFALEKKRVEAAMRGEIPAPEPGRILDGIAGEKPLRATGATVGSAAPDFTVPRLGGQGSLALRNCRGSNVLVVFYNPSAPMTEEVMLQMQQWAKSSQGKELTILPLTVRTDQASNQNWARFLGKELPIYDGSGLRITYGVDVTPRLVLVDKQGIVRALHEGWGGETRQQCAEDLAQLLAESSKPAATKTASNR